jgi:hypothetical protein
VEGWVAAALNARHLHDDPHNGAPLASRMSTSAPTTVGSTEIVGRRLWVATKGNVDPLVGASALRWRRRGPRVSAATLAAAPSPESEGDAVPCRPWGIRLPVWVETARATGISPVSDPCFENRAATAPRRQVSKGRLRMPASPLTSPVDRVVAKVRS